MPQKPMLSVQDLIVHSKEKGIQFNSISEAEAQDYLARNNNYFKLASYRKNYPKFTDGPKQGQYENLDFAYLIELARIDVEVRHILLKMCLDIEHFLKVRQIRNAAAHNSCIINDLNTTQKSSAPPFITQFAARAGIGRVLLTSLSFLHIMILLRKTVCFVRAAAYAAALVFCTAKPPPASIEHAGGGSLIWFYV